MDGNIQGAPDTAKIFRSAFKGVLISAGGYSREDSMQAVESGTSDAIAFGRYYISNPDLVERLKANAPFNKYDRSTFYGGAEKGYTDYPTLEK
jgi:N-ethylmaleimide reductase